MMNSHYDDRYHRLPARQDTVAASTDSGTANECREMARISRQFMDVQTGNYDPFHFLDTTCDRRRRLCSMAVRGNRAQQAKL
jgi:predicted RNA-binding Zn ribbon-like protein